MKMRLVCLTLLIVLTDGCKTTFPVIKKGYNIVPGTKSFVLIDGGITSAPGMAIKKKRNEVVKEVKEQYFIALSGDIQKQLHLSSVTYTILNAEERNMLLQKDLAAIAKIRDNYKSAIILILKECSAGFRQGDVNKIKNADGTSKTAEYNVFFDAEWMILQDSAIHERTISAFRYHSSRSVLSGLLARGPGFEANKEDLLEMARQNASSVALLFEY